MPKQGHAQGLLATTLVHHKLHEQSPVTEKKLRSQGLRDRYEGCLTPCMFDDVHRRGKATLSGAVAASGTAAAGRAALTQHQVLKFVWVALRSDILPTAQLSWQ